MRFEVYAPSHRPKSDQRNRWVTANDWRGISGDLALCRTMSRPYRFWLAPLETNRRGSFFRREAPILPSLARRLMYGLDQRSKASVNVRIDPVPQFNLERELRLFSWPAWEELRLLHALAADVTPFQTRNLPLCFRFTTTWWPDIRWALNNLALNIQEPVPN